MTNTSPDQATAKQAFETHLRDGVWMRWGFSHLDFNNAHHPSDLVRRVAAVLACLGSALATLDGASSEAARASRATLQAEHDRLSHSLDTARSLTLGAPEYLRLLELFTQAKLEAATAERALNTSTRANVAEARAALDLAQAGVREVVQEIESVTQRALPPTNIPALTAFDDTTTPIARAAKDPAQKYAAMALALADARAALAEPTRSVMWPVHEASAAKPTPWQTNCFEARRAYFAELKASGAQPVAHAHATNGSAAARAYDSHMAAVQA